MKRLILLSALLIAPQANADLLTNGYVSPENYAVNEADLQDYKYAQPAPKLNIDNLDDMRFNAPNLVEKDFQIGNDEQNENITKSEKSKKVKKVKKDKKSKSTKKVKETKDKTSQEELQPYQKKLSYKIAKWWVDQRYKREEPHHGNLHEIKVNKRIENEQKFE